LISVLLATIGPPHDAETSVRALASSTIHHDVELVVAVDDKATGDRLQATTDLFPITMIDCREDRRGAARAWNDALQLSIGDPLVLAATDVHWRQGWLTHALTELSQLPGGCGMIGFNDGESTGATHYLVTRRTIREAFGGVIAWECYRTGFQDLEATERAKRIGRYRWCAQAHADHHWDPTRNPDPTSEETYARRSRAGFPNDYPAVI